MRKKAALALSLTLCLFGLIQIATGASSNARCALPPDLRDEISKQYPGTHIVTLADLDEYDRRLFHKDHATQCPGLIKVDFYGDGKPTWAFVLISGENPKRKVVLIVARDVGDKWETRTLETTDGTPVVWSEGPGTYEDIYGEKTIRAIHSVILFVGYGGWAVVYAWTGKGVEKVWLRD